MKTTITAFNVLPLAITTAGLLYIAGQAIPPRMSSPTYHEPSGPSKSHQYSVVASDDSTQKMYLPDDLEATIWAEAPMFHNPTNMDIDAKGRTGGCGTGHRVVALGTGAYGHH